MTERMAEQDDPFLVNDEAPLNHPGVRIPILPAEWQRTAAALPLASQNKRRPPWVVMAPRENSRLP
jgi:hypothetical protein